MTFSPGSGGWIGAADRSFPETPPKKRARRADGGRLWRFSKPPGVKPAPDPGRHATEFPMIYIIVETPLYLPLPPDRRLSNCYEIALQNRQRDHRRAFRGRFARPKAENTAPKPKKPSFCNKPGPVFTPDRLSDGSEMSVFNAGHPKNDKMSWHHLENPSCQAQNPLFFDVFLTMHGAPKHIKLQM